MKEKKYIQLLLLLIVILTSCSKTEKAEMTVDDESQIVHMRVGVLSGKTHDLYVSEFVDEDKIFRFTNYVDLFNALKSGQIDVAYTNVTDSILIADGYPSFEMHPSRMPERGVSASFNPKHPELRDQFDRFLDTIMVSPLYEQMKERWMKSFKDADTMGIFQGRITKGEPIRVITTANHFPFNYAEGGVAVGFEIDLMRRFAYAVGRPLDMQIINGMVCSSTNQHLPSTPLWSARCWE